MKTYCWLVAVLITTAWNIWAQTSLAPAPSKSDTVEYVVAERGPHHRVWNKVEQTVGLRGEAVLRTNLAYVELATGMHRLERGQWVEARPEIELTSDSAEGRGAQHEVRFEGNLNTPGAIQLKTPEGRWMKSHVVGLAYQDVANEGSVLIAEVKDCPGYIVGTNQIIYVDAFDGIKADVRYTYTRDGFEQDIILREKPPEPEVFNLDPETTDLLVMTEFVETDEPIKKPQLKAAEDPEQRALEKVRLRPRIADEDLDFGAMRIGPGQAFKLEDAERKEAVSVSKQWTELEGRKFLIERVTYDDLWKGIGKLTEPSAVRTNAGVSGLLNRITEELLLPEVRTASTGAKSIQMARAEIKTDGYVLDFLAQLQNSANLTLQGDTTYCVSGPVLLSGTTTIEGGTVVKYAKSVSAGIMMLGAVVCKTDAYRPAIFTAKDDDSVGESISSGALSGSYASTALNFLQPSPPLKYLRIAYAIRGIAISSGSLDLRNSQILDCGTGVYASGDVNHYAGNVLFHRVNTAFSVATSLAYSLLMENLTFRNVYTAVYASIGSPHHSSSTRFVNCLFSSVLQVGLAGGCGGCGNVTQMGIQLINSSERVVDTAFTQVGAGASYLATSQYRDTGTLSIDANLLKDLKKKTTYAPVNSQTTITTPILWKPTVVLRDDDNLVDRGYHYDPLDYIVENVSLTATLTMAQGVAVGIKGTAGLIPGNGGSISSTGSPLKMNRVVSLLNVQEQASSLGGNKFLQFNTGTDATRTFRFRFTDFSVGQGKLGDIQSSSSPMPPFGSFVFQDCWLRGGTIGGTLVTTADQTIELKNNLLLRSQVTYGYTYGAGNTYPVWLNCYNNHFHGGLLSLTYIAGAGPAIGFWYVKDNLFDKDSLALGPTQTLTTDSAGNTRVERSNNGFTSGTANNLGGSDWPNLQTDYRSTSLGDYYYPPAGDSPSLGVLINKGSRTAPTAGLYHFTTQTSQAKEANSQVDIGYHYASVDQYNILADDDGDGLPDYLEDTDGDGTADSGESNWQISINGLTFSFALDVFTPLKN